MTMSQTTTRDGARSGTLSLPTKTAAPPQAKTIKIPKPLNPDRGALETSADVSVDLEPRHRKGPPRIKQALDELAKSLVELTRDVPLEPRDTRSPRLSLAVVELAPECPTEVIIDALRAYALGACEPERVDAKELKHALHGCVNNARLIRFRAMLESAISIIEERRVEGAREQQSQ
jgi:hypothetical protein